MESELNTYNIIILSLADDVNVAEAGNQLSEVCSIDEDNAVKILNKVPIMLFKGASEEEMNFARPYLEDLAEFGINFKITKRKMDEIPKVNWPEKPDLVRIFKSAEGKSGDNAKTQDSLISELTTEVEEKPIQENKKNLEPQLVFGTPTKKEVSEVIEKNTLAENVEDTITMEVECPCCGAMLKATKAPGGNSIMILKPAAVNPFAHIIKKDEIKIKETVEPKIEISEPTKPSQPHEPELEEEKTTSEIQGIEEIELEIPDSEEVLPPKELENLEDLSFDNIEPPITSEVKEDKSVEEIETPKPEEEIQNLELDTKMSEPESSSEFYMKPDSELEIKEELNQITPDLAEQRNSHDSDSQVIILPDSNPELDTMSEQHETAPNDIELPQDSNEVIEQELEIPETTGSEELKFDDEFSMDEEFSLDEDKNTELESEITIADDQEKSMDDDEEPAAVISPPLDDTNNIEEEEELEPWTGKARNYVDPELELMEKRKEKLQSQVESEKHKKAHIKQSAESELDFQDDLSDLDNLDNLDDLDNIKEEPKNSEVKRKPQANSKKQKKAPKAQMRKSLKSQKVKNRKPISKETLTNEEIVAADVNLDDGEDVLDELGIDISKVKIRDTGKIPPKPKAKVVDDYTFDDADEITFEDEVVDIPESEEIEEDIDIEIVTDELEDVVDELADIDVEEKDLSGNCTVYINKIPPKKIEAAVKLMLNLGISDEDARKMASRMVFPVQKDVNEIIAEKTLNEFKKIGIQGRIRKK